MMTRSAAAAAESERGASSLDERVPTPQDPDRENLDAVPPNDDASGTQALFARLPLSGCFVAFVSAPVLVRFLTKIC